MHAFQILLSTHKVQKIYLPSHVTGPPDHSPSIPHVCTANPFEVKPILHVNIAPPPNPLDMITLPLTGFSRIGHLMPAVSMHVESSPCHSPFSMQTLRINPRTPNPVLHEYKAWEVTVRFMTVTIPLAGSMSSGQRTTGKDIWRMVMYLENGEYSLISSEQS